ncbi:MAG: amino acid adenylation domain-containing protein [Verrucomicrobiota bacterium]
MRLQQATGDKLAKVLRGDLDPVEILFPSGKSIDALSTFYREGGDFAANNDLMGVAVQRLVASMPERRSIRILEVGAGTGSLTGSILPVLPAHRAEYTFTDTSPAFLMDAKKQFSAYPFVEYSTFDIEKPPESQGIDVGGYDLVLATNVVHATADLKNSLGNLQDCLSESGAIMFLEVVNERVTLNNVFGLLRGWWYYQDTDLRPSSALMPRDRWEDLLSEMGFRDVGSFVSSEKAEECQQAVFLAMAPLKGVGSEDQGPEGEADEEVVDDVLDTFVVLADDSGVTDQLSSGLNDERRIVTVRPGAAFSAKGEAEFTINPAVKSDWERLFAELKDQGHRLTTLVHCWTLDDPGADISLDRLESVQTTGAQSIRVLVHAMHHCKPDPAPRIVVVTRGRVSAFGEPLHSISSSPLTGICRVVNNEHPEWATSMIDLDAHGSPFEAQDLIDELLLPDGELEIAYRDDVRNVNRLHRVKAEEVPMREIEAVRPDGRVLPYRLEIDKPGVLQNLSLNETPRIEPGAGEIEVRVKAGGINFRDVMKALGMYPGNPVDLKWFGDDVSGTVVKVGPGVKDLKPGDNVVGMAPYAFRSYVTVNRNLVFRKPDHLSFEEAATLPTVFLTSHYALVHLARMQKGERVLIHAGTGGVGQAAVQIARHLGLEIFSTAGTDEKRQLLTDMGVHHVMNSRTLDFADEIMEITNGEGIDCVLNSLAGDFIPKSFQCLRRFGRFIEIGKIDVYGNTKFGMEMLKNNISYFVVDLAQHLESKPAFVASMLQELEDDLFAKNYTSLPHSTFPITDVVEAFRFMAQGKHIGKNVLNFDLPSIKIGPCTQEGHRFRADRSYLITGGAGGFGFELAKWMAKNGARNLILVSRSGPKEDAQKDIRKLESEGVTVVDARADVTDKAALKSIIDTAQSGRAPLAGVIHGAMVINDLDIIDLDEEGFNRVVHPKMLGAWVLHELTLEIPLDLFVSFSSFSNVMGAVRQSNYNAGNSFLDAIAQHRRSLGLPGLTFNWGALKGAGFVERNEKTEQYLELLGLSTYDMRETTSVFGRFISREAINVAASRADWNSLARFAVLIQSKTYSNLVGEEGDGDGGAIRSQILQAAADSRLGVMADFIAEQVAGVFGTDVSKIDKDTPLNALGLDSLMAIELMNRVESQLGISVPMGSVLNGPNIKELSEPILEALLESAGDELSEGDGEGATSTPSGTPMMEISGQEVTEFPLSEGQKALWFLHQLAPESPAYNLVFSSKIRPFVDIEVMQAAFKGLFERHPMLDVTFHMQNGEPIQRLNRGGTVDFREHDASNLSDGEIMHLVMQHANKPFDLRNGPVVRLELFRTKDDAHIALLSIHHIVSDAWSVTMVMNDLIESYVSRKIGKEPEWDPIKARYHDFVNWEQLHLEGQSGARMKEYWVDQMAGAPLALDLPTDRPRPPVQTFNGGAHGFKLNEELTGKVIKLAEDHNVTLFTTLLSAFDVLLHRYCNQDDVVVGVPLAGRSQPDMYDMSGYFINPVPVRSQVNDDPTFSEYLARNSTAVVGALENQHYPLAKLVDTLDVPRDPSRSPIFQVSFSMERLPGMDEQGIAVFLIGQGGHQFHIGDITVETVDLTLRQAQFEITLVVEEAGGQIYGCWQYNADLFDESSISNLNGLFSQILTQVVEKPELRVSEVNLLSAEEEKKILTTWNNTSKPLVKEGLLHSLVEAQVAGRPDEIAIRSGGDTLTFNQLDRRADGLAQTLSKHGIKPDMPVALLADRSCDMVVGTLGILKSGGCYVPMDPEFPAYRLEQMLVDAQPSVLVTQRSLVSSLPTGDWKVICLEDVQPADSAPEVRGLTPESLAYIIYTSGSTGVPKGVEIPHRAAVNFLNSMQDRPGMDEDDRLLAVTTLSFDISLLELYLPLISGAECVIASREEVKDGRHLGHMLDEFGITVMQATPATWRMLLEGGWKGKDDLRIYCGGEGLPRDLANRLLEKVDDVWNLYGPTETTVWSTCDRVDPGEGSISIGRPIANTTMYVLDSNLLPVPVGFVGDLYIGGSGLARGYHRKESLTAEKFIDVTLPGGQTERLYETGDLARWRSDGKLECLGRSDFQIKLRGVRMELDDIEFHVASHPRVKQAVVIKREDLPGGPNLVAYLQVEGSADGLVPTLRSYLADRLPESMRPAFFSVLEDFPLTPNRKVGLMIPLAGSGVFTTRQIYPFTLGANIGTTITALLAATSITGPMAEVALTIALVHVMFNVFAVALIYGVPVLSEIPLKLAEKLAEIGTNNKSAALGYILGSFFVVPGLIVLAVR